MRFKETKGLSLSPQPRTSEEPKSSDLAGEQERAID